MSAREKLIRAVLDLPESAVDDALEYVASRGGDPLSQRLDASPLEDELISSDEEAAVEEARSELAAGVPTLSHEEVKRELGSQ